MAGKLVMLKCWPSPSLSAEDCVYPPFVFALI